MKRFLKDSFINVFSNMILVSSLQLMIFPLISRNENNDYFAILISIYGIILILATSFGNTLNNVRLINNKFISDEEKEGIFTRYIIKIILINMIIIIIVLGYYSVDLINSIFIVFFTILLTLRYYLNVYFREKLNYKKMFLTNISVIIGYLIGLIIYLSIFKFYGFIFFLGELSGFLFLSIHTSFRIKNISSLKNAKIFYDYKNYVQINLIINVMNYLDRIILLPIVGSVAMTTYFIGFTASKVLSMLTTPINNVILSYLSLNDKSKHYFSKLIIIFILMTLPMFFIIKYLSLIIVKILYNNYLLEVSNYMNLIVIICLLSIYNSIVYPFAMNLLKSNLILKIQLYYALFYLFIAVGLSLKYNLYGFCIATILALLLKLIVIIYFSRVQINIKEG